MLQICEKALNTRIKTSCIKSLLTNLNIVFESMIMCVSSNEYGQQLALAVGGAYIKLTIFFPKYFETMTQK